MRTLIASLAVILGASAAHADSESFPILSRQDSMTKIGASFGLQFYPQTGAPDIGLRLDTYGQFVFGGQAGIYGSLPLFNHVAGNGSATSIGNLEVGGFYAAVAGPVRITVGGGLGLALAPESTGGLASVLTASERLTDVFSTGTLGVWTLRLLGTFRSGSLETKQLFWQADVGLDIALADGAFGKPDPAIHLNGALGYRLSESPVSLMMQMAWYIPFRGTFAMSLSPSVRYAFGKALGMTGSYVITFNFDQGALMHAFVFGFEFTL